jgi:hypothetical protein
MQKRWVEDKSGGKKKSYEGETLHDASLKEKGGRFWAPSLGNSLD